jgi:hypothetical protein
MSSSATERGELHRIFRNSVIREMTPGEQYAHAADQHAADIAQKEAEKYKPVDLIGSGKFAIQSRVAKLSNLDPNTNNSDWRDHHNFINSIVDSIINNQIRNGSMLSEEVERDLYVEGIRDKSTVHEIMNRLLFCNSHRIAIIPGGEQYKTSYSIHYIGPK